MTTFGEDPSAHPVAAATALFQTIAALRPEVATATSRRLVVADLVTRDASPEDRHVTMLAGLVADFGRVALGVAGVEGCRRAADVLRTLPGLETVADAVQHRYERVDGTGSPSGLSGGDIPFGARVIALADVVVGGRKDGQSSSEWDRRLELMKDSAGQALDIDLAAAAYELLHTPGARALVDRAGPGTALAMVESAQQAGPAAEGLGALLDTMEDPDAAAEALAVAAWRRSDYAAVGVHRVTQSMLTPVASVGDEGARWSPLALTEGMARLTEPSTLHVGDDTVTIVPIRCEALWGFAWGVSRADDEDPDPIAELAAGMELAVRRHRDRSVLERLALGDELTGLANRRRLEQELVALFADDPAARADVALIMCDVDGLKRVNDTRGHAAGDEVLRAVAAALDVVTGDHDTLAARLGGDEFCVLMRSGGILRAQTLARELASQVATSAPAGVGLSCGVAWAAHADSPGDLLRRADEAQYLVKRQRLGRPPAPPVNDRRRRAHR